VIFVRRSRFTDYAAIAELAALDDKEPCQGPCLLAEVDGDLVAATPLDGEGPTICDPSEDTEAVAELLTRLAASLRQQAA
jgi:hypothetical protein